MTLSLALHPQGLNTSLALPQKCSKKVFALYPTCFNEILASHTSFVPNLFNKSLALHSKFFEQNCCCAWKTFKKRIYALHSGFLNKSHFLQWNVFEQKLCFAPKMLEQKSCFAPKMIEQKSVFAMECVSTNILLCT